MQRSPYRIPAANALAAFESAARQGSFTLAAHEIGTSQSAVSRYIGQLETWLGVRLFERSRAGVTLTDAGERYRDGVAAGLATIQRSGAEAAELANPEQVVIACSHEASPLPHHAALCRAAPRGRRARPDPRPDLTITTSRACRPTRPPTSG